MKINIPAKDDSGFMRGTQEVTLVPGCEVQLWWNGYSDLPQYLHCTWARVERFTSRGGIVVTPYNYAGEKTVKARNIRNVREMVPKT